MTQTPEALWTAQQVAAFLQLSLSWVRHATAEGRLPCHRIGHNVRYEPEAVRAWVARSRQAPGRILSLPLRTPPEGSRG